MSVKEILSNLNAGNMLEAKKSFDSVMTAKMEAAISAKYDAMYEAAECDEPDEDDEEEEDTEKKSEYDSEEE